MTGRHSPSGLRFEPVAMGHPEARRMIALLQQEYVVRYGGQDATPVAEEEFAGGAFLLGRLGEETVATGAWRWRATPSGLARELGVESVVESVVESSAEPHAGALGERCAEIKRMFVLDTHRHRGFARAMLAALGTSAAAAGAAAIVLETGAAQPEAIALYASSGYVPITSFGHYRDSPQNRCFGRLLP